MLSYKKILRTKIVYAIICWIGAKYIQLVSITNKWNFINKKYVENLWKRNEAFILCFWHGRLLMMPLSWDKKKKILSGIGQITSPGRGLPPALFGDCPKENLFFYNKSLTKKTHYRLLTFFF